MRPSPTRPPPWMMWSRTWCDDMEMRLSNIGYTLEDSLRLQGKTMDAYHRELRPLAEKRLKGRLALLSWPCVRPSPSRSEEVQAELERMVG